MTAAPPRAAAPLTDGDLTALPSSRSPRGWWRAAVDRLAGSDPGLTQLRTAVQALAAMTLSVAGAGAFVALTGALQVDPAGLPRAVVAAQHHGALVIALLVAGLLAMQATFSVHDTSLRSGALLSATLPLPMLATMAVGIALAPYHALSLVWLVVALVIGVYLRRFGPRGFAYGLLTFQGAFLGYFLAAQLSLGSLGWIAAIMVIGVVASLVARYGLLRQDPHRTLLRMWTSWRARAQRLLELATELTDTECNDRHRASLHDSIGRQLTRLNESTLMIDAQLGQPDASRAALVLHQRLFDMELALTNVCRFAVAVTDRCPDSDVHHAVRQVLLDLRSVDHTAAVHDVSAVRDLRPDDPTTAVLLDRFGQSVEALAGARREWLAVSRAEFSGDTDTAAAVPSDPDTATHDFTPAVDLVSGWLPGSGPVSDEATKLPGPRHWWQGVGLSGPARAAIQVGVAATISVLVGGLLSDRRLYWALLATFLAFLATSNSGEQVRKALFRVGGTLVGIVLGAVIVHLIGGNLPASVVIIGVALFFGIYLIRVNYTFMVIGITITMSLLYVQLGEYSWSLLVLRLEETAIGVGAVVVTVLLVVPLRPQRVLTAGVLLWFRALNAVVDDALTTLAGGTRVTRLGVRNLDAAYQSLVVTARPLQHATFGRNSSQLREILAVATAARNYARNLATGARPWTDPAVLAALEPAAARMRDSLAVIDRRLEQREFAPYVRSAALFNAVDRALPDDDRRSHLVLRDLMLLDGALARLATSLRLPVEDLDTTPPVAESSTFRSP
ncbi:FUSC family protein [Jatrophihabitans sp. YIM 134969]